jgi:hypothetical protein
VIEKARKARMMKNMKISPPKICYENRQQTEIIKNVVPNFIQNTYN